jgi:hypothetical protein
MAYPDYDDRKPDFGLIESALRELTRVLLRTARAMLEDMGRYWQNSITWFYEFGPYQKRKLVSERTRRSEAICKGLARGHRLHRQRPGA